MATLSTGSVRSLWLLVVPNKALLHTKCFVLCGKGKAKIHFQGSSDSGSVVEYLTRDQGAVVLSLTGDTVLFPLARHIYLCLVLVQPRKTCLDIAEKLLTKLLLKNQIKKIKFSSS